MNNRRRLLFKVDSSPTNYITFSGSSVFARFSLTSALGKTWDGALYYSTDTINWFEWDGSAITATNKLYLCGENNTKITGTAEGPDGHARFVLTRISHLTSISCDGNIESLLDWRQVEAGEHPQMASSCFEMLFYNNPLLLAAIIDMPATTLSNRCYTSMFEQCEMLQLGPASLPSNNLTVQCYARMFYHCDELVTPPSIGTEAIKTDGQSMQYMFYYCGELYKLPALHFDYLADNCCMGMFGRCSYITLKKTSSGEATTPYSITVNGYVGIQALGGMFYLTDTDIDDGTPAVNTTYYTSNEIV